MLKREWDVESNGKLPHLFIASKTATLLPEFAVEDLPSTELQTRFCACSEGPALVQSTFMMISETNKSIEFKFCILSVFKE